MVGTWKVSRFGSTVQQRRDAGMRTASWPIGCELMRWGSAGTSGPIGGVLLRLRDRSYALTYGPPRGRW